MKGRSAAKVAVTALLVAVATACEPSFSTTAPSRPASSESPGGTSSPSAADRTSGWASDLDVLLPSMVRIHPDLYHSVSKAELQGDVDALKASVPHATDDELMVGVLRLVARVSAEGRDGHTGVFVWGTGAYSLHSLPLRLWLFPDGLFVVDALPPYRELVGSRIVALAGHPTSSVLRRIWPLIPRDNGATRPLLAPRYLLIPEILRGLDLTRTSRSLDLSFVDPSGHEASRSIEAVPMDEYNHWAGPYGLHLPPTPGVLYLSRSEVHLWFRVLRETGTLYLQYNRVEDLSTTLLDRLRRLSGRPNIQRLVIDIRHNYGGISDGYLPLLRLLVGTVRRDPRPLYVITGRNTFSAASLFAARLQCTTHPIFVGEPAGGSPNLYGNSEDVTLPYSGLAVSVASQFFVGCRRNDPRLTIRPDISVPLSSTDYFAGRDPALATILAGP
jgi:Peptidase family S41